MLKFTGKITGITKDLWNGGYNVTISTESDLTMVDIPDGDLNISIGKERHKRSLDANAYAWVLMQKIAEKVGTDKWSVYLECLKRYSRAFTHIIVKESAVPRMKELYRECVDLGEVTVNGQTGHQLQVYFGSSTFDKKEMSVFIDGIIEECRQLGIPTATPREMEAMKTAWRKY